MEILNDNMNSPLRYTLEDGTVYGQFYNSRDKLYHLAAYAPYELAPARYLCGHTGNFSPSRNAHGRNKCEKCFSFVDKA